MASSSMDIAELGYSIDSRPAAQAANDLRAMGTSFRGAEDGAKKFDREARNATTGTQRMNQEVERSVGKVERLGTKMQSTGRAAGRMVQQFIAMAAAVGLAMSFGSAINDARELDAVIGELSTLLPGATDQLDEMSAAGRRMGVAFGTGTRAQIQAFYAAVSAGATTAAIATARVDAANRLAIGGATDLQSAIGLLNTATNAYAAQGLTAADASDILFTGVRTGVTTVGELSGAIGRVIPAAAALGISFDEVVGSIAALTTQGQSTNLAVTGVTAAMSQLLNPSSQAAELASDLGLNFSAAGVRAHGFAGFMEEVVEKTGGSQEQMARLFGSVEALRSVFSLAGEGGVRYAQIMAQMEQRTGAANVAFEAQAQTLNQRLGRSLAFAAERSESFGRMMLSVLVPGLEAVIAVMTDAEDHSVALEIFMKALAVTAGVLMVSALVSVSGSMIAASASTGIWMTALELLTVRGGASIVMTQALGAAVRFALGPIGLAITAVGLLTAAWVTHKSPLEIVESRYADLFATLEGVEGIQTRLGTASLHQARNLLAEAEAAQTAADAQADLALQTQRARVAALRVMTNSADRQTQVAVAGQLAAAERELAILDDEQFARRLELAGATSELRAEVMSLLAAEQYRDRMRRAAAGGPGDTPPETGKKIADPESTVKDFSQMLLDAEAAVRSYRVERDELTKALAVQDEALVASGRELDAYLRASGAVISEQGRMAEVFSGAVVNPALAGVGDELARMQADYEARQSLLEQMLKRQLITIDEFRQRRSALESAAADERLELETATYGAQLGAASSAFDSIAAATKTYAGEQSGAYKAMFAISKGFAIAQASLAMFQAVAEASKMPFPANIPLMAEAAAQGLIIINNVQAISEAGFQSGGYTGDGPISGVAGKVHYREGVLNSFAMSGIGKERLDYMNQTGRVPGESGGGGRVLRMELINETGVPMRMEQMTESKVRLLAQDEVSKGASKAVAAEMGDPNSSVGRSMKANYGVGNVL
jgi:TP901 family phage tail tape measure protein